MNKKFFASLAVILFIVFSFSVCLATTNGTGLEKAADDVRNFVGGAENTVENAALDISNTSKDMTGHAENTMSKNTNNTFMGTTDHNDDGYTATRTNTNGTVMGITSTAWTWIILGIAAIAIIALVWYYSMQFTNNNHHNGKE